MSEGENSLASISFAKAIEALHSQRLPLPKSPPPLALESFESRETMTVRGMAEEYHLTGQSPNFLPPRALSDAPTVSEAILGLKTGRFSSRCLLEEALEAMKASTELGTVVAINENDALKVADSLDSDRALGITKGPLHGIPISVKDVIDVAGLSTMAGSRAYFDLPEKDATSVARLRAAGALIFSKVATHEFALGVTTPQCKNPYDPSRISGGSSGGSAIAVATGVGLASLGTDTRASLRVPASLCGVVGFKPTFARVPTDGVVPLSWTIDHVGPITRSVRDAAILLNILANRTIFDPDDDSVDLTKIVVGVVTSSLEDADPEVSAQVEHSIFQLVRLGIKVVETGPSSEDFDLANSLGLLISRSEAAAFHRANGTDLKLCIPEVRDQLSAALEITAVDYLDAQRHRKLLAQRTLGSFEHCDVLLMPTTPLVAPPRSDYERYLLRLSRNAILWSLLGAPAVSMPCGSTREGLPVGLQLAASPGNEHLLCSVGIALEEVLWK